MYFNMKNYLKNNCNYTVKQARKANLGPRLLCYNFEFESFLYESNAKKEKEEEKFSTRERGRWQSNWSFVPFHGDLTFLDAVSM